ncbi:TetR/AcrR family transcriptional regulator [Streptomyces sp. NPDC050560]|uniref:TetR/AcrR family transcriptional regulator n=1 Tax=Streptomyces sp. NPDC050560 TaxID=3365630 RepID=UPI0037A2717D
MRQTKKFSAVADDGPCGAEWLRRLPVQQRSRLRLEQMLEAAAALIDEIGYRNITTTLIAERAGVAVGSLYQFFPDKRALVRGLTLRNLEVFEARVAERIEKATPEHWWDAVDPVIDTYVDMLHDAPGFAPIRFGDVVDLRLLDPERDNNLVIADRLVTTLAERFGEPALDIRLPIAVAVDIADAVLAMVLRHRLLDQEEMTAEAKRAVHAYLDGRLR